MARIDFKKYVKITSGVAGGSAASRRDLNLRLFTTNAALPYGQVLTCDSADGVGEVFGSSADEYTVAVKYLGFISKSVTAPKQISFFRWAKTAIDQTYVYGKNAPKTVDNFVGQLGFKLVPYVNGAADPSKNAAYIYWDIGDEAPTDLDTVAANLTTKMAVMGTESAYSWLKGSGVEYSGGKFVFNFDAIDGVRQDIRFFEFDSGATETATIGLAWLGFEADQTGALPTVWKSYLGYTANDKVYYNTVAYKANASVAAPTAVPVWSNTAGYAIGDLVTHDSVPYTAKVVIAEPESGETNTWDKNDWNAVPAWDDTAAYTAKTATAHGSFVLYGDNLYECTTAIPAPAIYEHNTWDESKWTTTNLQNEWNSEVFDEIDENYHDQYGAIAAEAAVDALSRCNQLEDNFGQFAYMEHLSAAEAKKVAAYNKTLNYKYMFYFDCKKSNYTDYGTVDGKLYGYECVHGVYANKESEFAWWLIAAINGSTDYTRANSTKTAMYYQGTDIAPSVGIKSDTIGWYKTIDAARLNYYGETMKSGSPLRFYQDGVSMNGVDTACEMNEIWFKDACETEIINLLILMEKVPANDNGSQMIAMMVDGVAKEALNNGTIIKGKTLTSAEKLKVDTLFAEEDAWKTLYGDGYKFQITLEKVTVNGTQKWAAKYLLAYLMGEAIKYVEGTDLMF